MDLRDLNAIELARNLVDGETTVAQHAETVLDRISQRDPKLNAFSQLNPRFMAEASALDALPRRQRQEMPLFGVPVAIKEELWLAAMATTFGGRSNSSPAETDSEVVARLKAAGALIVGKTNMPEFGQSPFTQGQWGETNNPYNLKLNSGGSSGGSAVAVAAGMVPLALGSDAGGSIRIPAAWTCVVGLKPSRDRVSTAPHANIWHRLGTYGPLARTVDDVRLAMEIIAPATPGLRAKKPLKVGWTLGACLPGIKVDHEVARGVEQAARKLAAEGHHVEHGSVNWGAPGSVLAFMIQCYLWIRAEAGHVEHPELLEKRSQRMVAAAKLLPEGALRWAERKAKRIEQEIDRVFKQIDVLLTPVTPTLPLPNRWLRELGSVAGQQATSSAISFTSYWNLAGNPALSIPVGLSEQGLPLAVQVIGRLGADDLVLDVAERLMSFVVPADYVQSEG